MKETILVHQSGKHNKYWRCKIEQVGTNSNWRCETNWGRIGAPTGSSQVVENLYAYDAETMLDSKSWAKKRKGYRIIDQATFDRLHITARVVGLQNKAEWEFVKLINNHWTKATEDELVNPNITPGIKIEFATKDTKYTMVIVDGGVVDASNKVIQPTDERYALYEKASQAIAKTL